MKNLKRLSLIPFILLITLTVSAQLNNHLILKKGPKNIQHFLTGDSIHFMKNSFKSISNVQIQGIGEDFIYVNNEQVMIKDISGIVKVRALHFKAAGTGMKIAGPSLILIDGFNSLLRNFRPVFGRNVAIAGAALFATGFVLPLLQTKVYDLNKAYYLRIVPADPDNPLIIR